MTYNVFGGTLNLMHNIFDAVLMYELSLSLQFI